MLARAPFSEAHTIFDIAERAELDVNLKVERMAPTDAEIIPGACADWYLVQAFPGDDERAKRWLARRRFGVFRPMQQRWERKSGKRVQGWEPAFPGWLLVFCWDIEKMRSRILSCPGVMGILSDPATGKAVAVDQPEMTENGLACVWPRVGFVDRLRSLAWIYDENAPRRRTNQNHFGVRGLRQVKRSVCKLGRRERRDLHRLTEQAKICGMWDDEQWETANRLDPGQRIALLKRTLLHASDVGGSVRRA